MKGIMPVIISITKQPLCIVATDSSQVKAYDFEDLANSQYTYDAQKLHVDRKTIIAEGGNPMIFSSFKRRVTLPEVVTVGLEYMLKRAPTLLNRSARAWETESRIKHPKVDLETLRQARHTWSIVAGWNDKRRKIMAGAVADNPALNNQSPDNGFLVQCFNMTLRRAVQDMMKEMLFGPRKMLHTREGMEETAIKALHHAASIEEKITGVKTMGGPLRLAVIEADARPQLFVAEGISV
jgi:hypothetical protein